MFDILLSGHNKRPKITATYQLLAGTENESELMDENPPLPTSS